jgi:hypothetical protein
MLCAAFGIRRSLDDRQVNVSSTPHSAIVSGVASSTPEMPKMMPIANRANDSSLDK